MEATADVSALEMADAFYFHNARVKEGDEDEEEGGQQKVKGKEKGKSKGKEKAKTASSEEDRGSDDESDAPDRYGSLTQCFLCL